MLQYIFLIFGGSVAILSIFLVASYLQYLSSAQKEFYITFGGDLTFTGEGKSTWIIDNRGDSHEKLLLIYWNGNSSEGDVPSQILWTSDLVDQSGRKVNSDSIKFNNSQVLTANFTHGWNKIYVTIKNFSLPLGSYNGNFILDGSTTDTIPITISTKPLVEYALILVTIGALLSVCIWEVIRYYKNNALYKEEPNIAGLLGNQFKQFNPATFELTRQYIRNSNPRVTIPKILIIEFLSVLLGIAVALFGVILNESVTGVLILVPYQVLGLLGIGLATGSLKELLDKIERPP